ncbi:MAG: PAS domain S-box protein [Sideroxyarcus sp.]|nr:PAS domain S-box protein [Sideroxyarcus sp.]
MFGLTLLFMIVWQAPALYTVQGLASYLPLHMFAETFSIVVSMLVFGVAWNVYSTERPGNIIILACALLAVGLIDFAHTLSFKGMPDLISPSGPEKAINLWLAARLIAALALLTVAMRSWQRSYSSQERRGMLAASLAVSAAVIWLGLAYPQAWPRTFIAGQGLTPFKIGAEYAIVAILLIPAVLFYRQARQPQSYDAKGLFAATVITILSELSFTVYSDVADIFNLLGHVYKIVAYMFIYRAVFVSCVREPFQRLDAELAENHRITQKLQAASIYTRSLIEASLDPLVTISAEGKISDVNKATEAATGCSRSELIGTDFSDCFAEPDKAREGYRQAFLKGFVADYPLVLRHRDGHCVNMLYNASVYRNEEGKVLGVFASARDVTEQRQAELVSSQLAAIVESSSDAIIGKSLDGIITSWNKGAEKIYGYTAAEAIGKHITMLAPAGLQEKARGLLESVRDGGTVENHETERLRKDGTTIHVALTLSPIRDASGKIGGISTIARDITERKRMEQERSANLGYFESMDKVNRAMQGAKDLEGMLSDVLGVVLEIFDCDRVGLVYPCDPQSPSWQIVMERAKPGYGTESSRGPLPMTDARADSMQWLLNASGPVQFIPEDDGPLSPVERFGIRSFLSVAIHPRIGGAWEFGIHQCSQVRIWSNREEKLFEEIGHRLADGLNIMLANRNLLESEQRYRLVFENSPVSIWEDDFSDVKVLLDGLRKEGVTDAGVYFEQHPEAIQQCAQLAKIVDVNAAALELHGARSKEELLAGLTDTFTPESFETFRQELVCLWNGGMQMLRDAVVRTLGGELRNVTVYFTVCPGYEETLGKVIVSLVDITGRKQMEESLKHLNERFSLASRAASLGVWDWNLQKNELVWNDGMYELYGVKREDFAGAYEAWLQGIHPDDRALSDEVSKQAQRGEREYDTEFRVVWPDGSIHHLKAYGQFVRDAEGNPLRMTGINFDITERKQAEEKLRRSEHGLAEAQRIAHLGNWGLDLVKNTLIWSDEIYRIFEIDPDKFGASYEAFLNAIHPEDRDMVNRAYSDSVKNKEPYDIVHRLQMPDGRIKYVNEKCETYYREDGTPLLSFGTVHDITERKLDEMALLHLNRELHAISSCNQSLMRADNEQALLDEICRIVCEDAGYRMAWVGYPENDEAKTIRPVAWAGVEDGYLAQAGITWADTERGRGPSGTAIRSGKSVSFDDFSTDPKAAPWREAALQRGYRSSISMPLKDEKTNTFGILTIYSGEPNAFTPEEIRLLEELAADMAFGIVVLRTRVERQQAENEIRSLNRELEQRVAARTADLEAANKELESFSYSVSHDLRSPLRAIDGFSHILLEDYAGTLDDEGKRMLKIVRDNTSRMGRLIDDILKFSRSGRTEINAAEIDMAKMAREVMGELQTGVAQVPKLQFEVGSLPPASGDHAMMRQVFVNLLSNALKFSRTRETPRIELGASIEGNETVYHVKDNGVGFDMQYADKLFGVFQRLHSVEEFEGTGIGLAIVKRIITRHGGRVWAESKINEGATIYFSLPTSPGEPGN